MHNDNAPPLRDGDIPQREDEGSKVRRRVDALCGTISHPRGINKKMTDV